MSHKINSNAMRLGFNRDWKSIWYDEVNYATCLLEDVTIKRMLAKALRPAGIHSLVIKRYADKVEVEISAARPGVVIGRGGAGVDDIKAKLVKITKKNVEIKISEVRRPDLSANIVASAIAEGIERRQNPKLLMASFKNKVILAGAKGVKIMIGGRIGGAKQARIIKDAEGPVPLQTIKANIDYAEGKASTHDLGTFGIKVWIYNPEKISNKQ